MALLASDKPASLIKRGMGVKQTMPPQKMPPQTDPPEKDPKPVGPPVNDTWDMSNVPPGMVRRGGQLFRLPRQAPPQMGEPSMKPPRPAPGMESYLRPPGSEVPMGGGPNPMQGAQAMMGGGPGQMYRRGRGAAVGSGMGNMGNTPGMMNQMAGPPQMSGGPAQVSGVPPIAESRIHLMEGQVPANLAQVYDPMQNPGAPSFGMPQMQNRRIRPPRDRWY